MLHAHASRQAVERCEVRFEHQRSIAFALAHVVDAMTVGSILMMERARKDEGYVGADEIAFAAFGEMGMGGLSAFPLFAESVEGGLEDVAVTHPGPPVLQIVLSDVGLVDESVVVAIVVGVGVLVVGEDGCAEAFLQVDVAVEIGLHAAF